jgi:uncharacterized protein (UPF0261 family)
VATVALLGTLDTKGAEYAFVRDRITEAGCEVIMINAGVLADPAYPIEFGRRRVAEAGGVDIDQLVASADRGLAVTSMAEAAAAIVHRLLEEGRIHALFGMGGSGGTSIVSRAMRELPIGVPKLLLSTMAAGNVAQYVGTSDVAMMYPVVDIAGINAITARVFANAAAAVASMAKVAESSQSPTPSRPLVGVTMYGSTTPCVDRARSWLDGAGYESLVFHATGPGGRSMEALMSSGDIRASLDVTTAELMAEIAGGTFTAGPDRLDTAGALGLAQVVSTGGVDQVAFSPPESLPEGYRHRSLYAHNPSVTLMRSNAEECTELGRLISEKLSRALGPVSLFVPLRGTSSYAVEGGVFHDPVADRALVESIRANIGPSVELVEMDTDINDPAFAEAMARTLDEHYRSLES